MLASEEWEEFVKKEEFMSLVAEKLLKKGREEGIEEGIEKGMRKGGQKARIEMALDLLKDKSIEREKILKAAKLAESQLREAEEAAARSRQPEGTAKG
jgi:lipopolysaccharide biosynthesis regulator YciM